MTSGLQVSTFPDLLALDLDLLPALEWTSNASIMVAEDSSELLSMFELHTIPV